MQYPSERCVHRFEPHNIERQPQFFSNANFSSDIASAVLLLTHWITGYAATDSQLVATTVSEL
jgi:hypothetical protein